jgi:hypothetical protein
MLEIVRADATRIDELEPLWLALLEHHGSVAPAFGAAAVTYRKAVCEGPGQRGCRENLPEVSQED